MFAGSGHYDFEFNALDKNNPNANVTTIYHFNAARDHIYLDRFVFSDLSGSPTLKPNGCISAITSAGASKSSTTNNGHLHSDFFSTTLGHEVHELFAILDTTNAGAHHPHHPGLTAADFVIA